MYLSGVSIRDNLVSINGLTFEVRGRRIFVNGKEWGPLGSGAATPEEDEEDRGERTLVQGRDHQGGHPW